MYKIFHNVDGEKISVFNNDTEFLTFMHLVANENGDNHKDLTTVKEAIEYLHTYCENLTLLDKTVFIAGFESTPESGGVSGWEWHNDVNEIDTIYNEWLETLKDCTLYRGTIDVSSKFADGWEITNFIEEFLDRNEYENAFENRVNL